MARKPVRDDLLLALGVSLVWEDISGDLFPDKAVVGLIAVECIDDVIAVAPSVQGGNSAAQAQRVRITC